MAETVRVEVKGLRELGERLKALGLDFKKGSAIARATTNAGAQVIKKLAVQKAPVSDPALNPEVPPGYLRDNIIARRQRKPDRGLTSQHAVTVRHKGAKANLRKDGTNPYQVGIFNEFGTVKQSPQPFMRPAFEQGKLQALEAMKKRLLQRIEKAEKGRK